MNVVIIGAGAAGLTAAICGAKNGDNVTVIEHESKPGKKIAITGNGKCNITNRNVSSEKYYGDKKFIETILAQFHYKDTLEFFENIGVFCYEKNGCYYPNSSQAVTIVNSLRDYALNLGVAIKTNNSVKKIKKKNCQFVIDIGIPLTCDKLIIAAGGMAAPKTGSDGSGYLLAEQFGHTIIEPRPALTGLICDNSLKKASGVRVKAKVSIDNTEIFDEGELQITDYGISGIPVFNISRMTETGTGIIIDFLPDDTYERISEKIKKIFMVRPKSSVFHALNGLLNEKLSNAILMKMNFNGSTLCENISDEDIKMIVNIIKGFKITVQKRKGFDFAQVTEGGVCTQEIDPNTMESRICENLYFAGEIIDVDGICGGYNLQFAWSSGYIAGGHKNL